MIAAKLERWKRNARRWAVNAVLLPVDCFVAAVLWQYPGLTISSRCGVAQITGEAGWKGDALRTLGGWLDKIDPNHCREAMEADIRRAGRTAIYLNEHLQYPDETDQAGA